MSLDITPVVPSGSQFIQSYGDGGFRISDITYQGSVLVFPEKTEAWPIIDSHDVSIANLADAIVNRPLILLVGCGATFHPSPISLRNALKDVGTALEWMDTGAACRTFNVLLSESRNVVSALIAV
ncbi:MAG: hypothetical protein CMF69_10575 [Magnetovibrio sp.]|nr:hypothetical protein [Magnetovibrio sp.]